MQRIAVHVQATDPVTAMGMASLLGGQPEIRVVGDAERPAAAVTVVVTDGVTEETFATLRELRGGGTVSAPGFDREIEEAVADSIVIPPSVATVIVEGNYLLLDSGGWGEAAALLDETFFVDVDQGIRLSRLIDRHERFGKTPDEARAWSLGPDEANAELIRATAPRADHTIRLD